MKIMLELDKKARILAAAMEIFGERPYHAVKMEEIAERASVGKGTVYGYFSGKDELFREMIHESFEVYFREALAAVSEQGTAKDQLRRLFHYHLYFIEKHASAARILAGERRLPNPEIEVAKERYANMKGFLSQLLSKGISNGEFREIDVQIVSEIFLGTFTSLWAAVIFNELPLAESESVVDKILDLYLNGLSKS